MPHELKETLRQEFDKIRDVYECDHLGSFEQIYPDKEDSALMQKYDIMLQIAKKGFEERNNIQPSSRARKA